MARRGAVVCGMVLLVSCGGPGAPDASEDTSAGMGVPQQRGSEQYVGARRSVDLRVHVAADGCFLGSLPGGGEAHYLVVWPAGTEQGASGDELRLPDGATVRDGDHLDGSGMLMPVRDLEGFGGDGYWDATVGFCAPAASDVLVLDSVTGR